LNLRAIWTVFRKEFRENLRDRRTLLSALVFGPVFGPVAVALLVQFGISHAEAQSDENIKIAVSHADRAPNLLAYLGARGIEVEKVDFDEAAARAAISSQTHKIVLDIPEDFGERLSQGNPAPVALYSDSSRGFDRRGVGRVRALISQYGLDIAQLRFLARGIDPISVLPIAVQEIDVSTPSSRSVLVLNMMSYLVLLSMLFGGLYLAIDATAGERERGSLEVLLTAPVPREHLIYGKIAAAAAYMLISLTLTVTMFSVAISFVGLEQLGVTANLGPAAAAKMIACCSPLVMFGAAYLTIVSAFAKSYREAQTYIGLLITIPTMPLMFAGLLGLQAKLALMFVPFLSQHLLLTTVVRAEPIEPAFVAVSALSTLVYGAGLMWIAGRLYRREKLLG
jgi:sodium transport system permease protein